METQQNQNNTVLYLLIATVGLIVIFSAFQTFQIYSLKKDMNAVSLKLVTANAVSNLQTSQAIDKSSWTEDEKMMYEHHGTSPSRVSSGNSQGQTQNAMAGGC